MTGHIDIALHEGRDRIAFRVIRRADGSLAREVRDGDVRVTEILLGDDVGDDRAACDELIDAIRAISRGDRELVEVALDATEVEVRPGTSRVRLATPADAWTWVDVSTRELHDALLQLRTFIVADR